MSISSISWLNSHAKNSPVTVPLFLEAIRRIMPESSAVNAVMSTARLTADQLNSSMHERLRLAMYESDCTFRTAAIYRYDVLLSAEETVHFYPTSSIQDHPRSTLTV